MYFISVFLRSTLYRTRFTFGGNWGGAGWFSIAKPTRAALKSRRFSWLQGYAKGAGEAMKKAVKAQGANDI